MKSVVESGAVKVSECNGVTKKEALNCVEWLFVEEDITISEYDALTTVIKMMREGRIDLGDGVCLTIVDESTMQ
jgi:hypothetical protein